MDRGTFRRLKKSWDNPDKFAEFIDEYEKQEKIDREREFKQAMIETVKNYSYAVAYTLNYKFGFGAKRLPEVMSEIAFTCDSFTTGHLNIEDCRSELERLGVYIENRTRKES